MKTATQHLAKTQHSGTTSQPTCVPSEWVDKLFIRFANNYRQRWTAGLDDDMKIDSVKREWQIQLAKVDPQAIAEGIEATLDFFDEWPPTPRQFVGICQNIARDRRMADYEERLMLGNSNREVAVRSIERILAMLRGKGINAYQEVHGMRHFV